MTRLDRLLLVLSYVILVLVVFGLTLNTRANLQVNRDLTCSVAYTATATSLFGDGLNATSDFNDVQEKIIATLSTELTDTCMEWQERVQEVLKEEGIDSENPPEFPIESPSPDVTVTITE